MAVNTHFYKPESAIKYLATAQAPAIVAFLAQIKG
jgi:hypothetical protein